MAIDYSKLAISKGVKRSTVKRRRQRDEIVVIKATRQKCVERDGYCRISQGPTIEGPIGREAVDPFVWPESYELGKCDGPSELAHMHARRRSKTRGMDPSIRHDPRYALMLCRYHHQLYDAKRLIITALSRKGANGPLRLRLATSRAVIKQRMG